MMIGHKPIQDEAASASRRQWWTPTARLLPHHIFATLIVINYHFIVIYLYLTRIISQYLQNIIDFECVYLFMPTGCTCGEIMQKIPRKTNKLSTSRQKEPKKNPRDGNKCITLRCNERWRNIFTYLLPKISKTATCSFVYYCNNGCCLFVRFDKYLEMISLLFLLLLRCNNFFCATFAHHPSTIVHHHYPLAIDMQEICMPFVSSHGEFVEEKW